MVRNLRLAAPRRSALHSQAGSAPGTCPERHRCHTRVQESTPVAEIQVAVLLNLKRREIGGRESVLEAVMGQVRFRSHLHFCKWASGVSRARLGAQLRHAGVRSASHEPMTADLQDDCDGAIVLRLKRGTVVQADAGVRP